MASMVLGAQYPHYSSQLPPTVGRGAPGEGSPLCTDLSHLRQEQPRSYLHTRDLGLAPPSWCARCDWEARGVIEGSWALDAPNLGADLGFTSPSVTWPHVPLVEMTMKQ